MEKRNRRYTDDTETRVAYLDQICADDSGLRERVDELLAALEKEDCFLKSKPNPTVTEEHSSVGEAPGERIGRYKLLQRIGEGGFGVVYLAEQQRPVRRKVALKILKPGMDTDAVIARFEAERQALAMMDSPNIARVLDGGTTERGRPYFVMELVKGVSITEYCDKNDLSTQERLKLFATVCHAVQHAHQKGIIHRDLKPSNILVTLHDGKPVVKVIDFGVAKAINQRLTERTLFTAYGQMVGTPQYMSPEQAEMSGLDVDTRSDIYSLGVLLYELLTGTTPLQAEQLRAAGYAEMQRLIRDEEAPRPSTRLTGSSEQLTIIAKHRSATPERLQKLVRGDLDWIVMKALDKDRSRRYETSNALAEDVSRFLTNQAVEAAPPSTSYRLWKLASRNRTAVLAGLAVFLALLFGLLGTSAATWRAVAAMQSEAEQRAIAQGLNQQQAATLAKLTTEYLDRAFGDAFAGDIRACENSLALATQVKADGGLIQAIHGLALMYGGRLKDAVTELDCAERDNPDNLAILSASLCANLSNGEVQKVTDISHKIVRLHERQQPRSDHERLLVAHTQLFGLEPAVLVAELDDIISRHPRWGIAYALRAEAKTQLAKQTRNMDDLSSARDDVLLAGRYHPDNAFVLASSIDVYVTAVELARYLELPTTEIRLWEEQAGTVSQQLGSRPNYLFGRAMRLVFYRLNAGLKVQR